MPSSTIIIIVITAAIHVIGLGVFFVWMAAGSPMSMEKFESWLNRQHLPFWKRQPERKHANPDPPKV
jgi:flagellar basal body-associated protein FliL